MKGQEIIDDVKARIEEAEAERVKKFVNSKLARLKVVESNIENFQDEKQAIEEVLEKIANDDFSDATEEATCFYSVYNTASGSSGNLTGNSTGNSITISPSTFNKVPYA